METKPSKRTVRPDAEAIKRLRIAKGWRVEDLAAKAICSDRTVENIERGANVYVFTLAKIAKELGVEPASLVAGGQPPPEQPKPQNCVKVHFELSIPFDQFDESEQLGEFIAFLKKFLRGGGGDFNVVGVTPGSTIVTLEMSFEDMMALHAAYEQGNLAEIHCVGFTTGFNTQPIHPGFKQYDPKLSDKTPITGDELKDFTRPKIEPQPGKDKKHEPKTGP
jgi:transcriptional regulator with XRE-family HTH domain